MFVSKKKKKKTSNFCIRLIFNLAEEYWCTLVNDLRVYIKIIVCVCVVAICVQSLWIKRNKYFSMKSWTDIFNTVKISIYQGDNNCIFILLERTKPNDILYIHKYITLFSKKHNNDNKISIDLIIWHVKDQIWSFVKQRTRNIIFCFVFFFLINHHFNSSRKQDFCTLSFQS